MTKPLPISGEKQLRASIRRWRKTVNDGHTVGGASDAPACVFGMLTRESLDNLAGNVEDIKSEIQWIRRVIVTAVAGAAVATILRFMGWAGTPPAQVAP